MRVADQETSDEPPFYISDRPATSRNPTAGRARSGGASPRSDVLAPDQLPLQSLHLSESSSDDYRSVIDDLTVENQQLRRRLMMYERLHSSRLGSDKLFEVTFHGLSAEKRHELEHALREFAYSVERASSVASSSSRDAARRRSSEEEIKAGASFGSKPRPADSGYGTNSISGQTSGARSSQHPAQREQLDHQTRFRAPAALHGRGKNNANLLTEHERRKLVVRRLEQLFTGKMSHGRSQGLARQQHEISQSAADADRMELEATGQQAQAEGLREARILPLRRESSNDTDIVCEGNSSKLTSGRPSPPSRSASPEQRPTRPLDLDLYRSQQPAENLSYIRHLGMSTPTLDHAMDAAPTEGWVYLNLLSNMAQLHTINVTPNFIREAVAELSTKLELSEDGRKIRWKGGTEGSKLSAESGGNSSDPDQGSPSSGEEHRGAGGRKRKLSCRFAEDDAQDGMRRSSSDESRKCSRMKGDGVDRRPKVDPRFAYRPLFFRNESTGDGTGSLYASSPRKPSGRTAMLRRDESGLSLPLSVGATDGSPSYGASISNSGPVIFYKGARFCTDLSGEDNNQVGDADDRPLGEECATLGGCLEDLTESMRPPLLSTASMSPIEMEKLKDDAAWTPASPLSIDSSPLSDIESRDIPAFEVSGLAGVHPADHFLIQVRTRRIVVHGAPRQQEIRRPVAIHPMLRYYSSTRRNQLTSIEEEIVHTSKTDLQPSTLPPPSFVLLSSSNSDAGDDLDEDDDDEDDEDDEDEDEDDDGDEMDISTPPPINDSDDNDAEDDESDTSDSSMKAHLQRRQPSRPVKKHSGSVASTSSESFTALQDFGEYLRLSGSEPDEGSDHSNVSQDDVAVTEDVEMGLAEQQQTAVEHDDAAEEDDKSEDAASDETDVRSLAGPSSFFGLTLE